MAICFSFSTHCRQSSISQHALPSRSTPTQSFKQDFLCLLPALLLNSVSIHDIHAARYLSFFLLLLQSLASNASETHSTSLILIPNIQKRPHFQLLCPLSHIIYLLPIAVATKMFISICFFCGNLLLWYFLRITSFHLKDNFCKADITCSLTITHPAVT